MNKTNKRLELQLIIVELIVALIMAVMAACIIAVLIGSAAAENLPDPIARGVLYSPPGRGPENAGRNAPRGKGIGSVFDAPVQVVETPAPIHPPTSTPEPTRPPEYTPIRFECGPVGEYVCTTRGGR